MVDRMQAYRRHDVPYSLPLGLPIEITLDLEQGSIVSSPNPSHEDIVNVNEADIELMPIKKSKISTIRLPVFKQEEALHKEIKSYTKYTAEPLRNKSNYKALSKLSRQQSNQSNLGQDTRLLPTSQQEIYREKTSRDIEERVRGRQFDFDKAKQGLEKSREGRASKTDNESPVDDTYSTIDDEVYRPPRPPRSLIARIPPKTPACAVQREEAEYDVLPDDVLDKVKSKGGERPYKTQDEISKSNDISEALSHAFYLNGGVTASTTGSKCSDDSPWSGEEEVTANEVSEDEDQGPKSHFMSFSFTDDQDEMDKHDQTVPFIPTLPPPEAPPAPPPMTIEEIKKKAGGEKQKLTSLNSHPLKHVTRGLFGKDRIAKQARTLLLDRMFKMIRRPARDGDYEEMKAFLYCHGADVEVIPKVGCDPEYYKGGLNIANMSDAFGNTPLLIACKLGPPREDIAMLLLKFGADPNHVDKQDIASELGDYPLECAAKSYWCRDDNFFGNTVRNQSDLMEQLVLHGADLSLSVHNLCKKLVQPNMESFDSMMELCVLVNPSLMMLTEEPIETAHVCSAILRDTGNVKDEYQSDCFKLADEADKFALSYLDSCNKLWEARRLLSKKSILENALRQRKKSFVAHAFCQELLLEEWYGGLEYRSTSKLIGLLFTYFFGSLLIPFYTVEMVIKGFGYRYTRLEDLLKKMMTPYLCFVADALNFLILLVLLIAVCVSLDQDDDLTTPTYLEVIMWLCLLTRFMIEFNQWCFNKRYFTNFWNYVDMLLVVFLAIAIVYRLVACYALDYSCQYIGGITVEQCKDWQKRHALNVIYIYSCSEIVLFLRLLNMLDITYTLGPLQLAVKRMLGDVVKLVVLLTTVVIAFSISISAIMRYAVLKSPPDPEDDEVKGFTSIIASCLTLFWSLFDLADVDALTIKGDKPSTFLTKLLFGLYLIIAVVIMLNMLIAMLNNTYQSIWTNQDLEWKFSRAKLFKEYRQGIPFIFPFLLIMFPIIMGYRWHNRKQKKMIHEPKFNMQVGSMRGDKTDGGRPLSVDSESKNEEKLMRYKLSGILSQRYADKNNMIHSLLLGVRTDVIPRRLQTTL